MERKYEYLRASSSLCLGITLQSMNINIDKKVWKSKDFYTSCIVLATKQVPLIELERSENNIVTFVFDDPKQLVSKIIQDHWNRKHKTISLDLIEAIKQLKTRIHSDI